MPSSFMIALVGRLEPWSGCDQNPTIDKAGVATQRRAKSVRLRKIGTTNARSEHRKATCKTKNKTVCDWPGPLSHCRPRLAAGGANGARHHDPSSLDKMPSQLSNPRAQCGQTSAQRQTQFSHLMDQTSLPPQSALCSRKAGCCHSEAGVCVAQDPYRYDQYICT